MRVLPLADFTGQTRLWNIKYGGLGNCPKDFTRNEVYLLQKNQKGRKEGNLRVKAYFLNMSKNEVPK